MSVKGDDWLREVGRRLRTARRASDWTHSQIHEMVHRIGGKPVGANTVRNWEKGRAAPRADYLYVICYAAGWSPSWILTGEEPRGWEPEGVLPAMDGGPPSENGTSESGAA